MFSSEIVSKIIAGDYEIRHDHCCECRFDWHIENDSLVDSGESDCCWEGFILSVDNTPVAETIRFEGREVLIAGLSAADIPDDVWDQMKTGDFVEQGESGNSAQHDQRQRAALVEWLIDCGYELDRDPMRGFANQYTLILRETQKANTNSRQDAERWADGFLNLGDEATQQYVGFRFESSDTPEHR